VTVAPPADHATFLDHEPRRILHVHKFRDVVGGVETHVQALIQWQRAEGAQVDSLTSEDAPGSGFTPHPASLREAVAGARTLYWSRAARIAMEQKLELFRPDVVHFHSLYHHLSPSVLLPCRRRRIPTVMTLHDYKLLAPCYVLHRDGSMCDLCVGRRVPLPAVRYRCVKGSAAASAICATEHVLHAPLYRAGIGRFLVPSLYMRQLIAKGGVIPSEKVEVAPLGVELPSRLASPADSTMVVFFGRLSPEKGVAELLDAWEHADLPEAWRLQIAGDGSLRRDLEARRVRGVQFVGHLQPEALSDLLSAAAVAVVPSTSPETFGLSAAEAMSHGLPVLASDKGNLPHLVGNAGLTLPSNDPLAWSAALKDLAASPNDRTRLGRAARERIAAEFTLDEAARRVFAAYSFEDVVLGTGGVRAVA
jgi:glycosyltransferase involved in cell wall biosynthesis